MLWLGNSLRPTSARHWLASAMARFLSRNGDPWQRTTTVLECITSKSLSPSKLLSSRPSLVHLRHRATGDAEKETMIARRQKVSRRKRKSVSPRVCGTYGGIARIPKSSCCLLLISSYWHYPSSLLFLELFRFPFLVSRSAHAYIKPKFSYSLRIEQPTKRKGGVGLLSTSALIDITATTPPTSRGVQAAIILHSLIRYSLNDIHKGTRGLLSRGQ